MSIRRTIAGLACTVLLCSCQPKDRNCKAFHEGSFFVETIQDGKRITSEFRREGVFEYDYFEGRVDTSRVRWVNDCECILTKERPANFREGKPVHIRIINTTDSSYTFDYGFLDDPVILRGTAYLNQPDSHGNSN